MTKEDEKLRKNGYLEIEEFVRLIHTEELDPYMRKFRVTKHKCPPQELKSNGIHCYYCLDCFNHCISKVKKYKEHYKVGGKKYPKEGFDE